ncbi:FtsX-like permease family protein [Actinoplanes sp. NPDC049265]|uniref:FtsX-like permease family protein n=1 Tax=Actinoplanes sp. NPDC049265 TaxID=3363902 RepID=UPI00371D39A5
MRARAAQSLMVLVLAGLSTAAAVAAPWYGLAVASRVAAADVAAAPPAQRVLSFQKQSTISGGNAQAGLTDFGRSVTGELAIAGATPLLGATRPMVYTTETANAASSAIPVAYRDDFCRHVRLTGACPAAGGDAAISGDAARRLKLRTGDPIPVRQSPGSPPLRLRVTGIYQIDDPSGGYWANPAYRAQASLDPVFTTVASFDAPQLATPVFVSDIEVPEPLLRGDNGYDLRTAVNAARPGLLGAGVKILDPTRDLQRQVRDDRTAVLIGVLIALGQVLLLGWVALGLAGRATLPVRRDDVGLLKLRGNTRGGTLRMTSGQHLPPLAAGVLAGLPVGFLAGWLLGGDLPVRSELWLALLGTLAAVLVVLLVAMLVLVMVDAATLRLPIVALLRRASPKRRGRAADILDLILIALAAAAVYQARSGDRPTGLGVVAPALTALAIALVLARVLRSITAWAGGLAVRRGRLRAGLAAVQVSRQPAADRVFVLVATAVAMLGLGAGGLAAADRDRVARAGVELGAERVLTVGAGSTTEFLNAVRAADPGGRTAMAVLADLNSNPPILAVDSSRLAAVARWRPDFGPVGALPAAIAAARVPAPLPLITGDRLELRLRNGRSLPALMTATLQQEKDGSTVEAKFDDIPRGEATVTAAVPECAIAPGCRFVRFQLATPITETGKPTPGPIVVEGLRQRGPDAEIIGAAQLGDVNRWFTDIAGVALQLSTTGGALSMTAGDTHGQTAGDRVYAAEMPRPMPVVLAGPQPKEWRYDDPATPRFGAGDNPVAVAAEVPVLPVVGNAGMMVDLDAARRTAADANLVGTLQVWLAPGAPAGIVDRLRAAGLTVTADRTTAEREEQLAAQGGVAAARFALLAVVIALLLAAGTVAVTAAAERDPYAAQLRALRVQGLSERSAVQAGYLGTAALVVSGLLAGVLAARLAVPITGLTAPPFGDGWRVVPAPGPLSAAALGLAALAAAVTLAVVGVLAARPLARRVRGGVR